MKRDLTSFALWKQQELSEIFTLARTMKSEGGDTHLPLANRSAALVFEKESLRTRVSFEVGIAHLGGHPIFLQQEAIGMVTRESVHDIGQILSLYNALIIARTIRHQTCVQLAESASVPVINALTDLVHPCQILADALTLQELGRFAPSTRIVYVGDGNNITNSWLELAEKFPLSLTISCPSGYEPHPQISEQAQAAGMSTIRFISDPFEAVKDADVIYTDMWPGSQAISGQLLSAFKTYQVNRSLLKLARPDCVVMHRLPAHRGEEITGEVLDGKQSIVLQQAENRLHVQKAVMTYLLRSQG